jgi:hypothetical protein
VTAVSCHEVLSGCFNHANRPNDVLKAAKNEGDIQLDGKTFDGTELKPALELNCECVWKIGRILAPTARQIDF